MDPNYTGDVLQLLEADPETDAIEELGPLQHATLTIPILAAPTDYNLRVQASLWAPMTIVGVDYTMNLKQRARRL
jgi:hypothetical protein